MMSFSPRARASFVLLLLCLPAILSGCSQTDLLVPRYEYWPITVENLSHLTLDIYLDDGFRGTLTPDSTITLPDVIEGAHFLEAWDEQGLRAERQLYLDREFVWVLE